MTEGLIVWHFLILRYYYCAMPWKVDETTAHIIAELSAMAGAQSSSCPKDRHNES